MPKDYEINSSGDFSLMQGYRTILYSKEDFGNLSIANNSQTIISPVIKYLDKDGILHDTQTPAVVQSTEAVVQSQPLCYQMYWGNIEHCRDIPPLDRDGECLSYDEDTDTCS